MLSSASALRVPSAQRARAEAVFALTDAFCTDALDDECAVLCRRLTARLARKRPTPLATGRPETWAAGVVHVIARLNFLFDASQTPHIRVDQIAEAFVVGKSTAAAKASRIEQTLGLPVFDHELTMREVAMGHPMAWLVSVDGVVVDARALPIELQRDAHAQGLIPFVPGDAEHVAAA